MAVEELGEQRDTDTAFRHHQAVVQDALAGMLIVASELQGREQLDLMVALGQTAAGLSRALDVIDGRAAPLPLADVLDLTQASSLDQLTFSAPDQLSPAIELPESIQVGLVPDLEQARPPEPSVEVITIEAETSQMQIVKKSGTDEAFTPREQKLLDYFRDNAGRKIPPSELRLSIDGTTEPAKSQTISKFIRKLKNHELGKDLHQEGTTNDRCYWFGDLPEGSSPEADIALTSRHTDSIKTQKSSKPRVVVFTAREQKLLEVFKGNPGHPFSPSELSDKIDSGTESTRAKAVYRFINKLKKSDLGQDLHEDGDTHSKVYRLGDLPEGNKPEAVKTQNSSEVEQHATQIDGVTAQEAPTDTEVSAAQKDKIFGKSKSVTFTVREQKLVDFFRANPGKKFAPKELYPLIEAPTEVARKRTFEKFVRKFRAHDLGQELHHEGDTKLKRYWFGDTAEEATAGSSVPYQLEEPVANEAAKQIEEASVSNVEQPDLNAQEAVAVVMSEVAVAVRSLGRRLAEAPEAIEPVESIAERVVEVELSKIDVSQLSPAEIVERLPYTVSFSNRDRSLLENLIKNRQHGVSTHALTETLEGSPHGRMQAVVSFLNKVRSDPFFEGIFYETGKNRTPSKRYGIHEDKLYKSLRTSLAVAPESIVQFPETTPETERLAVNIDTPTLVLGSAESGIILRREAEGVLISLAGNLKMSGSAKSLLQIIAGRSGSRPLADVISDVQQATPGYEESRVEMDLKEIRNLFINLGIERNLFELKNGNIHLVGLRSVEGHRDFLALD